MPIDVAAIPKRNWGKCIIPTVEGSPHHLPGDESMSHARLRALPKQMLCQASRPISVQFSRPAHLHNGGSPGDTEKPQRNYGRGWVSILRF